MSSDPDDAATALLRTQRNLEALDEATRSIAAIVELETVLQLIADRVRSLVGSAYAALGVVDAAGTIERFITSGISDEVRERIGDPPRGHGLLGLLIREGRPVRAPRIADHPDSVGFPPNHPPMTSFLGVPVTVAGGSVGNLYLTDKLDAPEFSADDQALVEMFARHAGIAIERARLYDEVARFAVVDERTRIGRDLHDGIIQSIYAVVLSLDDVVELMDEDRIEAAQRVDRAIDRLNLTIRELREFIFGLGPDGAAPPGLIGSIVGLVAQARIDGLTDIALAIPDAGSPAAARIATLPMATVMECTQMTRELLSNVTRHAAAAHAAVAVDDDGTAMRIEVVDDGRGFDPTLGSRPGHLGLVNLRERAAAIGATLAIDSGVGRGTTVSIVVPHSGVEDAPRD